MSCATIGSVLEAVVFPLIIFPFLARVLSNHDFGQVLVLWSLVAFITTVIGGNLPLVIYRRHKDFDANQRRVFFGRMFWFGTFVSVGITAAFLLLYNYISDYININIPFHVAAPFLLFMGLQCINGILGAFLGSDLQFRRLLVAQLCSFVGSVGLISSYYLWGDGLWSIGLIISPLAYFSVLLTYLIRNHKIDLHQFPKLPFIHNIFKEVLVWIIAATILNFVIFGDRWIMAWLGIDFSQIAAYSIAVQANMILIFVANKISVSLIPLISNMASLEQLTCKMMKKILIGIVSIVAIVLVGGSIAGPLYIKAFYGQGYWNEASNLFYIMLGGIALYPLQIIARGFLIRFHPPTRTLLINLCGFGVILGGLIIFGSSMDVVDFSVLRTCAIMVTSIGAFSVVFAPFFQKLGNIQK